MLLEQRELGDCGQECYVHSRLSFDGNGVGVDAHPLCRSSHRNYSRRYIGGRLIGMIHLKRVYETAAADDGARFLVERLWPRGIKKEALRLDVWLKDAAPSTELRKWLLTIRQSGWNFRGDTSPN